MIENDKLLQREYGRAASYKLLAEAFYPPSAEMMTGLAELGGPAGEPCSRIAGYDLDTEGLTFVQVDHSKLFVGPFALLAPPYGSVYLEGKRAIMGDSTVDARNWYRTEGLDLVLKEVPDHVTVELEFMHFLVSKEIQAIENSDPERAKAFSMKQWAFLSAHLGAWTPEFVGMIVKNADSGFYRLLGEVTGSFIVEDLRLLSGREGHEWLCLEESDVRPGNS